MADFYDKINANGIILTDTSGIQAGVEAEFRVAFGADIDLSPETPQGRLVALITTERAGVININAANANQINLDYCTGLFLDAVGAFFTVQRIGATSTRVLATVTGVSGAVIPANSLVRTDDNDKYYAENDITIPSGGSITSYFLSSEDGPIPCDTGTLTTIVSATSGWDSISNPAPATIGRNSEADVIFRARIKNSRYSGRGFLQDIKTGIESVDDILSSFVYDNGLSTTVVYDGITIDGHSIVAVVDGGADVDVAQAIFDQKDAGCGYTTIATQDVTQNITDGAYGVSYPVTFNRPDEKQIEVEITVKNQEYSGEDLEQEVIEAILLWSIGGVDGVDGMRIGFDVSPFEIAAAVSASIPSIYVKVCKIDISGGTPVASEIEITSSEVGRVIESNITVTVE